MLLLILALTLPFKTPFFFNTFYMGFDRETLKYLDIASGGSFLHVSANSGRSILTKVLENTPEEVE